MRARWTFVVVSLVSTLLTAQTTTPQSHEERIRQLEEQNRAILDRLQSAESRNAALEAEVSRLHEDNSAVYDATLETQVNRVSSSLQEGVTWKNLVRSGNPLKFYGFIRLDAYYNSARFDSVIVPSKVQPENGVAARDNDDQFALDARLTRFGFDVNAGKIGSADVMGKLETDFANFPAGIAESRETPRIRLAYIDIDFGALAVRMGQDWDVISPIFPWVNAELLMWNAGNLGDRRPQIELRYDSGDPKEFAFQWVLSAGLTGAINNQDLDTTGAPPLLSTTERDGFDAGHPHGQTRAGVTFKSWVEGKTATVGVWGALAGLETDTKFQGQDSFTSWLGGLDATLPLFGPITAKGEFWIGKALGDFRGGIGQAINTALGDEIAAIGGWGELQCALTDSFTVVVGGTVDNPDANDLSTGNADLNWSMYLGTRYDAGGGLKLGLDAIYWETQYKDVALGNAVRLNFYTQLDF